MSVLLGLLLVACGLYWISAALIDLGVSAIRCAGYNSTSAVPGVATVTGLIGAVIVREWFGWIDSPVLYLAAVAPDLIYQLGEIILLVRVRVLGWPDRARPSA